MNLFRFLKPNPPASTPPAPPARDGSAAWQAFARDYLSDEVGEERIRSGLQPGVIERLTPEERAEAERRLLGRLARGGDSRAAVGLGLMRCAAAVEPLRAAMRRQAGLRPLGSPAHAEALWRIARDPEAVDAVIALARDAALHESVRVDAVVALAGMASPASVPALQDILRTEPAYLMRFHAFRAILMLHGHSRAQADGHAGPLAPHIAGAAARAEARETVMAKLAELTQGRGLVDQP